MYFFDEIELGEFIELKRGYDLPYTKRNKGNIPIVTSSGINDFHNVPMVHGPGVVTGRYGTIGEIFYLSEDFWPLNTTLYVCDFKGNNPKFVYYFLKTIDWQQFNDKSGVPGINRNDVHALIVKVPSTVKHQTLIADALYLFDQKIELNKKMNETLEQMAQAVFQDWFVDFGPVKRKAEGITDPVAILGGLISNPAQAQKIASLFPDQFAENGLPRGWDLKPLTNLASIISGGTPKTSESKYWNGDIPWYSVVDAPKSGEVFVLDTQKHITIEGLNNSAARLIRPNVTIISARGTVGKLAIAEHTMCFNQSCYGIEANNCINDYFIYLNLINSLNKLQNMAYGSVFSTITRKTIGQVFINIPSNDLLISFSACVGPLFNLIKHNGEQNRTLAEMRDLLLPKLMSGEISVDELEKKMGGVL
jgi:Restriction endonuclease S subunits